MLVAFWRELVDWGTGKVRAPDQLEGPDPIARQLLGTALDVVQIAQAQQSALAGDFILPLAYERLTGDASIQAKARLLGPSKDDEDWWNKNANHDLIALMADDKLLARNFGLYLAHRRLMLSGHTLLAYRVAYGATDDSAFLDAILGSVGPLSWSKQNSTWTVVVAGLDVQLPGPDELSTGGLFTTAPFNVLTTIRGQLVDEIAEYDVMSGAGINSQDKKLLEKVASVGALP